MAEPVSAAWAAFIRRRRGDTRAPSRRERPRGGGVPHRERTSRAIRGSARGSARSDARRERAPHAPFWPAAAVSARRLTHRPRPLNGDAALPRPPFITGSLRTGGRCTLTATNPLETVASGQDEPARARLGVGQRLIAEHRATAPLPALASAASTRCPDNMSYFALLCARHQRGAKARRDIRTRGDGERGLGY
jgi:hypothetical protein